MYGPPFQVEISVRLDGGRVTFTAEITVVLQLTFALCAEETFESTLRTCIKTKRGSQCVEAKPSAFASVSPRYGNPSILSEMHL